MAIDRQLYDFFPQTVTITTGSGSNNYGETTYGASRTAPAYFEDVNTLNGTDQVDELTFTPRVIVADTSITISDKITLPDGSTPEVAAVETHTVVGGLEHSVVTFR